MNIKITKEQSDLLKPHATIGCFEYGSSGGNDKDLLWIIPNNVHMDACLHNRDHFLFYKDEEGKVDNLFATPRQLLNGIVTGSSTLFYEMMLENKFKDTSLSGFNEHSAKQFQTYKLAKALTGVAQRDLKQAQKMPLGSEANKKIQWVTYNFNLVMDILLSQGVDLSDTFDDQVVYELHLDFLRQYYINKLPKCIDNDAYLSLIPFLGLQASNLSSDKYDWISEIYFNNWRESL